MELRKNVSTIDKISLLVRQHYNKYTLWLFNIAMENGPFIDDFPIKTSIYKGLSMAMLNNQMVCSSGITSGVVAVTVAVYQLVFSSAV